MVHKQLMTTISTTLAQIDNYESLSCVMFRQTPKKNETGEFFSVDNKVIRVATQKSHMSQTLHRIEIQQTLKPPAKATQQLNTKTTNMEKNKINMVNMK